MDDSLPTPREQGGLLYVGIAGNPARRFQEHAVTKEWWWQVDWIHVEHYRTRLEAAAAEIEAIRTEQPKYNVAQVTKSLSGLPRISSVSATCGQSIACLAATYGAFMYAPAGSSPGTISGIAPELGYLYGLMFAAAAFLIAQEIWRRSVEQQRTLPFWVALVLMLGLTVPVGIGDDTAAFRPGTALGSLFISSWLILRQLIEAFVLLSLWDDLPWKDRPQEPRSSSLRDRLRGLRSEATSRP
jgi:hypothetical protein